MTSAQEICAVPRLISLQRYFCLHTYASEKIICSDVKTMLSISMPKTRHYRLQIRHGDILAVSRSYYHNLNILLVVSDLCLKTIHSVISTESRKNMKYPVVNCG